MQSWDLERKIRVTQTKLLEWFKKYDNKVYVSFSGGKDSTVLADLTARLCNQLNCKLVLWFSDTGLEFPELKQHTKTYTDWLKNKYNIEVELVVDYPKDKNGNRISFKQVINDCGYPVITKTISRMIHDVKKLGDNCWASRCFDGRETGIYKMDKWKYLIDSPFKISDKCCNIMKKNPAHKFEKQSGLKSIIGVMASESANRKKQWLKNGCNAFDKNNPTSQPMSFWTDQDVLKYIKDFNIPYASVYGAILQNEKGKYYTTGYSRTGCVFCVYGCHLEKEPNRFQMLKQTHPQLWEYCMKDWNNGGLGMKEVLEYIGIKCE